jgi:hypothetical protein
MDAVSQILEGLIDPVQGGFSREHAQYVLGLKFPEEQVARYQVLAAKNSEGTITPDEKGDLEAVVHMDTFLTILKLKARRSLLQHSPAA